MNKAFLTLHHTDAVALGQGAVLNHPDDVLADRRLTREAKRAVLASWASDRHAVENQPSLRRLDHGAIVPLDAIMAALAALDDAGGDGRGPKTPWTHATGRRRPSGARFAKLFRKSDDDDDPPPTPAAVSRPIHLRRVNAIGRPLSAVTAAPAAIGRWTGSGAVQEPWVTPGRLLQGFALQKSA